MAAISRVEKESSKDRYARFTVLRRVEHLLLLLSFTALAITGLPQKFVGAAWAETMIAWMGGIENVRQFHHISAILLLIVSALEFLIVGYKIYVERARWTIMPKLGDVTDAWSQFLFNLGLRRGAPRYDRYSWMEKFEYWALVWGTVVMAITGFILWNPIVSTTLLPGELIPAAKAAHGGEAILAVLAVLVWHGYHVHMKRFNRSMFTGKLSAEEMQEEHPLELERIKQGKPETQERVIARRRRIFFPLAGAFALVLLLGIFYFTTMETTALATIPRANSTRVAFVPRTFTPTATRVRTSTPVPPTAAPGAVASTNTSDVVNEPAIPYLPISHEGRTTCFACHGTGFDGAPLNPPDHEGREETTCTTCHKLEPTGGVEPTTSPAANPRAMPISHEGRTTCYACHASGFDGAPVFPENHVDYEDSTCTTCHELEQVGAAEPEVVPASKPPALPISHEGRTTCYACHAGGFDGAPLSPEDHVDFEDSTCTTCHELELLEGTDEEGVTESGAPDAEPKPTATGAQPKPTPTGAQAKPTPNASVCVSCHPFDELMELAPMFEFNDELVNPHVYVPHDTEEYLQCTACHTPHSLDPLPEGPEDVDLTGVTIEACFSCHHLQELTPCKECH
jgi:cytochrome b subunit of formate dehydrogenase